MGHSIPKTGGCEWDPEGDRPAEGDDSHYLSALSVWSIGVKDNWHLCQSCAKLPRFKRKRRRVWIGDRKGIPQPKDEGSSGESV